MGEAIRRLRRLIGPDFVVLAMHRGTVLTLASRLIGTVQIR
jgi:hypothetical protein